MSHISIKFNQIEVFENILEQFNLQASHIGSTTEGRYQKENFIVEGTHVLKLSSVNNRIKKPYSCGLTKNNNKSSQVTVASLLYSLWSCHIIRIEGFKYPTRSDWDYEFPGMTVDHHLPKSSFPLRTFLASNWRPETKDKNRAKGDNLYEPLSQEIKKSENFNQYIASILY